MLFRCSTPLISIVFIILSSLILSSCQHAPSSKMINDLSDITLADIAFESGDMRAAIRLYQKVLAKPVNTDGTDTDGTNTDNNLDDTVQKQHIERSNYALAKAYRLIKQSDLSLHYLTMVNTKNANYYRLQGLNYLDSTRYTLAIVAFELALEQKSNDAVSLNGLGVAHSWSGQYQQSHGYLMQALALNPVQLEYKNNLALNYILRQQSKEAVRLLWPIFKHQQASDKIRNNLALALVLDNEEKAARQVLAQTLNQLQVEQNIAYFKHFGAVNTPNKVTPQVNTSADANLDSKKSQEY